MPEMKAYKPILIVAMFYLASCTQINKNEQVSDSTLMDTTQATSSRERPLPPAGDCTPGERLVYQDDSFSSYTEDQMRGTGVVTFELDVNDRLDIYYEDEAVFGYLVLNEDLTYYTLNMPQRLLARKVVPEHDFAAFEFDAEEDKNDNNYLYIYANKERLLVKKADVKYSYRTWNDYINAEAVGLKACNPLKDGPAQSKDLLYDVMEVNGDQIRIKSSKDCGGEDSPYVDVSGWVKWKNEGKLLVDLMGCI